MQAKNNYKVPLEIAFWVGLYILWVLVFQNRTITITRTIGIEFCYLVFIALNYYFTINYLIPTLLNKNKCFVYYSFFILNSNCCIAPGFGFVLYNYILI